MKQTEKMRKYGNARAVLVACEKYGAIGIDCNTVKVNGKRIDLSASGYEDWQVAKNIINQLNTKK